MSNIEIVDRKNIYFDYNPQYLILFYKNQSYDMIIERYGYHDFKYYYHGESIPDEETRKEIEEFLYNRFLNYEEWNRIRKY